MRCKLGATCYGFVESHPPVNLIPGEDYELVKSKLENQDFEYYIVKKDNLTITTLTEDEVNNYFEKGE